MKHLILAVAAIALMSVVACKNNAVLPTTDDTQLAVNELVTTGANTAFTTTTTTNTEQRGGCNGSGTHNDGDRHGGSRFDHPGRIHGDSIGFNDLPAAAQAYLRANNSADTIRRIVRTLLPDSTYQYSVRFTNRTHLHFDAAGALVADMHHRGQFAQIGFSALPAAAQSYLLARIDTALVAHIIKLTKADGTVEYFVRGTGNQRFHFDANGAFVAEEVGEGRHGRRH